MSDPRLPCNCGQAREPSKGLLLASLVAAALAAGSFFGRKVGAA